MANSPSAIKRIRRNDRRAVINRDRRNRVRTFIKKVEKFIIGGDVDAAKKAYNELQPEIMRSQSKGIFHKNKVARTLSRLNTRIKAMSA